MQTAELVAMPLADRLQAMEALWDSLCRDTTAMQTIPAWHEEVLGERLAALETGADSPIPWEEAKILIRQQAERFVSQRK
ncbi:MAG: addiction module protein [Rhodoferax sp.]|nr:addiction module protein [Rhodoferax sp.]